MSEAANLATENHQEYPEPLLYVMGIDKPPLSPTLMREYLELVDANGGWPLAKAEASAEFKNRYVHTPTGWIPRMDVE